MSNDNEPFAAPPADEPVVVAAAPTKAPMPRSTRILAFTAGGVVAAAALFGGGVAVGTSLNTGSGSVAQQGQFGGQGGPGGSGGSAPNGTAPNGTAPSGAPGGATTTG